MNRRYAIAVMLFAAVAATGASAQFRFVQDRGRQEQRQEQRQNKRQDDSKPKWGQQRNQQDQGNQPHRGDWLRKSQNLPPKEQERQLERDPEFRKLPPQGQERLRERLRDFNSRPPEQREQIIQRMERWDRLSPQQKDRARNVFNRFRELPPDRQQSMRRAARSLAGMSPEDRDRALNSPAMRNNFTDSERDTLRDMVDLGVGPGRQNQNEDMPHY